MAGDWLKFEKSTPDKPEVFAIAAITGLDPDAVVGKLLRVWSWFDTHTESGNAFLVTSLLLDRIAGATGFCDAMQSVGWLAVDQGGVTLPAFDRHTGQTAKARAETARRVANHRAEKKTVARPMRRSILERDGAKCVYCGRAHMQYTPPESAKNAALSMDHVIPESRGGTDTDRNLVCACVGCNMAKADRTPDEAGMQWPVDGNGVRYGESVTPALPREEKRREDIEKQKATGQQAGHDAEPQDELPKDIPTPDAPQPVDDAPAVETPKRITSTGKKQTAVRFAEFWAAYPVKKGKVDAEKKWRAKGCDEIADQIIEHVRMMEREDDQWKRGFVPHGSTYVNGEHWTDEPVKDKDQVHVTAAAPPPEKFGPAAALAPTESKLDNAIGYIRQQYANGVYGSGDEAKAKAMSLIDEAKKKYGGGDDQ